MNKGRIIKIVLIAVLAGLVCAVLFSAIYLKRVEAKEVKKVSQMLPDSKYQECIYDLSDKAFISKKAEFEMILIFGDIESDDTVKILYFEKDKDKPFQKETVSFEISEDLKSIYMTGSSGKKEQSNFAYQGKSSFSIGEDAYVKTDKEKYEGM